MVSPIYEDIKSHFQSEAETALQKLKLQCKLEHRSVVNNNIFSSLPPSESILQHNFMLSLFCFTSDSIRYNSK